MRNIIFGTIGVLWGGAILLVSWFGSGSGDAKPTPVKSKSAKLYSAGQTCGNIFGFLFFGRWSILPDQRHPRGDARPTHAKAAEEETLAT
jgi:hypothetical protein